MHSAPEVTGRRVSHGQAAKMRGISGRTLDRWVAAGIVPKPEIVNKRKYHLLEHIEAIGRSHDKSAA